MKRSRFSDEQIIVIVKEQEAGMATAGVCRRRSPILCVVDDVTRECRALVGDTSLAGALCRSGAMKKKTPSQVS